VSDSTTRRATDALHKVTSTALGAHQSAIVRIGFAGTWLLYLLWEIPNRHELYGPDAPWGWAMGDEFVAGNDAFTALLWSNGNLWFELVYVLAVLSSALLTLGWHTRAMSVVFMVGVLSLQNRSIFVGDGGDNVIHLVAIYLVLTRCGAVWSLDARRRERERAALEARAAEARDGRPETDGADSAAAADSGAGDGADGAGTADEPAAAERKPARAARPGAAGSTTGIALWAVLGVALFLGSFENRTGETMLNLIWAVWVVHALWWAVARYLPRSQPHLLLDSLTNVIHNAALLVIMAEVCLIYATAGWYKVQGSRWQDGTALYYPLNLDYFTPWPALSDLLAANGLIVMILTYGTVIVQVAFPFTLFNRKVKNVLLVVMMLEHAGIAVILGLPFFSMAMIAADAVFLPTVFLVWLGATAGRGRDRLFRRGRKEPAAEEGGSGSDPAAKDASGLLPEQRADSPGGARTLVG
jgi:hypothetical protein